jgi:hypothetical protein
MVWYFRTDEECETLDSTLASSGSGEGLPVVGRGTEGMGSLTVGLLKWTRLGRDS